MHGGSKEGYKAHKQQCHREEPPMDCSALIEILEPLATHIPSQRYCDDKGYEQKLLDPVKIEEADLGSNPNVTEYHYEKNPDN